MSLRKEEWLDNSLQSYPRSFEVRRKIVSHLWGYEHNNSLTHTNDIRLEPYFKYFEEQCNVALHDNGRYLAIRSYRDLFAVVNDIRQGYSREQIFVRTNQRLTLAQSDEAIESSIDFAARLCLMIRLSQIQNSHITDKTLLWKEGPVRTWIAENFEPEEYVLSNPVRLEKMFVARNLGRIANIKVTWTDNLADHLRLLDDDTRIAIFHHASFLKMAQSSGLYPKPFIEETVRTLALLFPQLDLETQKWLGRLKSKGRVDKMLSKCGNPSAADRQINNFNFWRVRLTILKQVFDETQPNSWKQWWYDRRSGVQRYPMLVAAVALILTALFGLIQCIEGGIQAFKAYHPAS